MRIPFLLFFLILSAVGTAHAFPKEKGAAECSSCHKLTIPEATRLMDNLVEVKAVRQAPMPGLFELVVESKGQQAVIHMDYGKKYILPGPVFDLATKKQVSEPPRQVQPRVVKIDTVPLNNSIILGNPKGSRKLFVFTDPECPYCAKLHWELIKLAADEPDLAIYIKLFPLKMHPAAYDKARVILGAGPDAFELLSKAFENEALPPPGEKDAKNPVDETIRFGESIGIDSTPTIILPDGRVMPGYREASDIAKLLHGK